MHTQEELYLSTVVSHQHKYKGLLKRSYIKNYRDHCFRFFDYLYTMASTHDKPVQIMRVLHYVQVFIICLCPTSLSFWPKGSVLGKIINILSIVGILCPPQSSEIAHIIVSFVIYSILLLFLIFLFINISIFHKYTKANQFFINFICIFLNALLPYFILYIGSNIGREISVITRYHLKSEEYDFKSNCYIKLQITCLLIGFFLSIFLFTIQFLFITPVLTFRPQSLHFLNSKSMLCYLVSYFVISILSAAAGGLNNYAVLFSTLIPILLLHFLTYFCPEAWGNSVFRESSVCVLETASILLIIEYLILIFQIKMNEIILLVMIVFFIIIFNVYPVFTARTRRQYLALCDRMMNSPELFEKLTEKQAIFLLRIGFENGHKFCHSWLAFEYADSKFPNNRRILMLTLRYATIYPDDHLILRIFINKVQSLKKNDIELKNLLFQLRSLCQQRERGLSKSLKKTLSLIDNKTDKCRNQIKLVWNNVIQGNISEIESLSIHIKNNTEEITREYNHLCISYPNNPYVASAFGAFLSDIWCKEKESMTFKRIYRLLRNGGKTRVERTYFFARNHFQSLLNDQEHSQMKIKDDDENEKNGFSTRSKTDNSMASMSIDNLGDLSEEATDDKSQLKYLETMIESVHLPSLSYGPILIFSTISLFFPFISLAFSFYVMNKMDANVKGLQLIEKECLQQAIVGDISIVYYYHVLNSNRLALSLSDILSLSVTSLNYLLSLATFDQSLLNEINEVFPVLFETGYFEDSLNFLFNDSITFYKVYSNYSFGNATHSYEFFITRVSESVLRAAPTRALKLLNMSDFWTIVYSYPEFMKTLNRFSEVQMDEMYKMIKGNYLKCLMIVTSFGMVALIVFIVITALVFKKMSIEKELIFMSFKSLPKSSISATISKLNAQLGRHDDDSAQNQLSTQEERALRMLTMNQSKTISKNIDTYVFLILLLFIICVILSLFFLIHSQKVIINRLPSMYSIMFAASGFHSTIASIILNQMRIMTYDQRQLPFNSLQRKDELINSTMILLNKLQFQAYNLLYGNFFFETKSEGLHGTEKSLINFFTRTPNISINNNSNNNSNITINNGILNNEKDFMPLLSIDNSIYYIIFLLNEFFKEITLNEQSDFSVNHDEFTLAIKWLFNTSFPNILKKIISSSVNSASLLHQSVQNYSLIIPLTILNSIIFLCGLMLIPRFVKNAETAKWTLRLLLFCPPNVVLQSRPIIKILSNDFSKEDVEDNQEKVYIYENVVSRVKDATIFLDNEMIIRSVNIAFVKMFGPNKIGTSLFELFTSPYGKESNLFYFKEKLYGIQRSKISPNIEGEIYVMANDVDDDSEKVKQKLIHFTLIGINIKGRIQKKSIVSDSISVYSLVLEDITKATELKHKLTDEKAKINHLLCQALPEKLISQFFKDDKNQFYEIQNTSIVFIEFLDIRRLSLNISPSDILLKLASIIGKINHSLSSFSELVKINSIIDNFVAVGGIIEQHHEYVKQAISFSIETIVNVNEFNFLNEQLFQIKIGVCQGGPVAAGLVEIRPPTFSVIGCPMQLAVELEKQSRPMCIHVPQSVFDSSFDDHRRIIKEDSQISFGNQYIETYMVSVSDA